MHRLSSEGGKREYHLASYLDCNNRCLYIAEMIQTLRGHRLRRAVGANVEEDPCVTDTASS
jgi:hypothetical protein